MASSTNELPTLSYIELIVLLAKNHIKTRIMNAVNPINI